MQNYGVIKNEIMAFLTQEKLLNSGQHGFMPHKSTVTQLVKCISPWQWSRNSKISTDVICLEFCKAFDKICHQKLFIKLECYGIFGKLPNWITNFLVNRTQVIKVERARSNVKPVLSGIGQDTCLGPLAFILYVNGLANVVEGQVHFAIYADDIKIWQEIKS